MPSLADLKSKWFIPMSGDVLGVPCRRHTEDGSTPQLSASTDGNTVTPLIDGKNYMGRWRSELRALHSAADAEFMHSGFALDGVETLGATLGGNALDEIVDALDAGVAVYPLITGALTVIYKYNIPSVERLQVHGVTTACIDYRFPAFGSHHQKFSVFKKSGAAFALLASMDIHKSRWDRQVHAPVDNDRDPPSGLPTHDVGIGLQGPAVADVELTYRERWNDSTRIVGLRPFLPPQPLIATPLAVSTVGGTHSVQILRTYGITNPLFGYSWSPRGEFTVWASYLNAILKASQYIYIEDQYFLPWGWPPRFDRTDAARDVDIVYQLGEAMKRGVDVVILMPVVTEDSRTRTPKYQRNIGLNYLKGINSAGAPGDIVVAALQNGGTGVYVHSKLMIVDDEFVLIGSANINQRSMTHDGEIHAGIVDSANVFARDLRTKIWSEHTGRPESSLADPAVAYGFFKTDTAASGGHLQPYPVDPTVTYPNPGTAPDIGHAWILDGIYDPYAGPPQLE